MTPSAHPISQRPFPTGLGLSGWLCLGLTLVAGHTCSQIEWRNYRAGGVLPRKIEGPGNPKWRIAADRTIPTRFHGDRGSKEERARPAAEDVRLRPDPRRDNDESQLRSWVASWGLAQYVVAPLALFLAIHALVRARTAKRRCAFAAAATLSGAAIGMIFYRGYFTSLGW